MIKFGASTACFYPEVTENAVKQLANLNVKTIEIFYNSPSEYRTDFLMQIKKILDSYGMRAVSMHPYNSISEPFMFFTNYERRFTDTLEEYKIYFDQMHLLGSEIFVFHGDRYDSKFPIEQYYERFGKLSEAGKQHGIIVAQENVQRCRSREISFIEGMKKYLGDTVHFVLDVKQAIRSGLSPFDMLSAMGNQMVHLHINDNDASHDCLLPGEGTFDFESFFDQLKELQYHGAALIEVYRQNFNLPEEIACSLNFLKKFQ